MSPDFYIARATALQVAAALREGSHFFCDQLPPMDIECFLRTLGDEAGNVSNLSLALVGYGLADTDLHDQLTNVGLTVGHVTTDLHVAARWRNEPQVHSTIIALAHGRHPGVSTLAHFLRGDSRKFAQDLLLWTAQSGQAELAATPPQERLLRVLAENSDLSPLVSLSGVAEFLASWKEARADDQFDAPRRALPRLGILPDRNLLSVSNDIADRLLKNFKLKEKITKMTGSGLEVVRRRVAKRPAAADRQHGFDVIDRAEKIRRIGSFDTYNRLDYEEAHDVFMSAWQPAPARDVEDDPIEVRPPAIRDGGKLTKAGGELLIDGNDDTLTKLVDRVRDALHDAEDGDKESASDPDETFEIEVEREVLTWVRSFCSATAWGGFFEAPTASLDAALRNYRQCEPTFFEPLRPSISHDGQQYSLRNLLEDMQKALLREGVTTSDLCDLWDRIVTGRQAVLIHLNLLIHQPILAIAGQPDLRSSVGNLLQAWDRFYADLAQHHAAMHEIDHAWTRLLFEAVASLDVVQIETNLRSNRTSWKAILLPTHPLHLWRYERIAALARGLRLAGMDRKAVLEQIQKPQHYLGVIYLTSLPEGRGGNQPLPVSRDYRGLALFENLTNAYSGDDGVDALRHCVQQFAQIYVNHAMPLRLALINPPNASRTLATLLDRSPRGPALRAPLLVDIYATPDHEPRLLDARRFSTKDRDEIEEHIAAGRLQLRVNDDIRPLDERLKTLRQKPVHIVAVFDAATTAMRHQPGGTNLLPMSPFAIRQRIAFQGIHRKVQLLPSMEESVFRSFYDMMARLQDAHAKHTPQSSADAERMSSRIEDALTHDTPAAFWFFFADRALPSPGRVRVARIMERHDGRRQAVCYDANYERLALLLRLPLDKFNLSFSTTEVQGLLKESVALLGDGLINLFKGDAQPDTPRVRGFAGLLVAARDYRDRHPGTLLVSVDTKLARLWLRLADTPERCDLLALRCENDVLIVDAIEVKTVGGATSVPPTDIEKATKQLRSTLEAIQSGLDDSDERSPLSAPRQEMLKTVFVSGCQALTSSAEERTRWAGWLKVLFRQEAETHETRLCGTIYAIELRNNSPCSHETLSEAPHEVVLRRLREARIQTLVSKPAVPSSPPEGRNGDDGVPPPPPTAPPTPPPPPTTGTHDNERMPAAPESGSSRLSRGSAQEDARPDSGLRFLVGQSLGSGEQRPYYLNPGNTKLNQLNIGVVGDLGTGKTQLTKALIYEFTHHATHNRGHAPKFLIFDYKHDYTKSDFVEAVGARVVSPHRIPLNVFDLPAGHSQLPMARLGRVKFLNDALQKIYGGIGHVQRNHLKKAILHAYKSQDNGAPTLRDVLREYSDVVGGQVDAPFSILSDLVDLEVFVDHAAEAERFEDFFTGVTIIDLADLGVGDKERNMLLVLFLNLYYEYMINLDKKPYVGKDPQLRFIDSMLLVDEADNIMKYNFDVLRQILLQGREFGVGVLLASQFLSHFKTRETDYSEPLLTWFVHKVPNVTQRELQSIGLNKVASSTVERVKSLDVHQCLYKTLDVPGRFMRALPFYEIVGDSPA